MKTLQPERSVYSSFDSIPNSESTLLRSRNRLGWLLGLGTFITAAAAATVITINQPIKFDNRGCYMNSRPEQAIEILIDQSDPFSDGTLAFVSSEVRRFVSNLGIGDLLSLIKLETSSDHLPIVESFSGCRPSMGKDVDWLTDNPEMRDREFSKIFESPLETAKGDFLQAGAATTSPLIEALYTISQRPAFVSGGRGRTLVIFSDGLQNTDLMSFFKRGYTFDDLVANNSVYLTGLHKYFSGACVEMNIIATKYARQTTRPEFESFWRTYWAAAGVECFEMKQIVGNTRSSTLPASVQKVMTKRKTKEISDFGNEFPSMHMTFMRQTY